MLLSGKAVGSIEMMKEHPQRLLMNGSFIFFFLFALTEGQGF